MISFPALLGRTSGTLQISAGRLVFTSDEDPTAAPFVISTDRAKVSIGGQNSAHYLIFDSLFPDRVITVQDEAVLTELKAFGVNAVIQVQGHAKERRIKQVIMIGTPIILILLLLLAFRFAFTLIPSTKLNDLVTFEKEREFGKWLLPHFKKELDIVDDHPAKKPLGSLVAHLQAMNYELLKIQFEIYVSRSEESNAFALPGGILVFNQGFLKKATSAEEIAGVLAHEMAHVERRHSLKSMAGSVGTIFGMGFLALMIGPDAAAVIGQLTDLISLNYSRGDEAEADRHAFFFLHKANIPVTGLIEFFTRLAADEGKLHSSLAFLSTHPLSEERANTLKQLAKENPVKAMPIAIPIEEFHAQ
jgi:beta-barrel assembly-enhancing protease